MAACTHNAKVQLISCHSTLSESIRLYSTSPNEVLAECMLMRSRAPKAEGGQGSVPFNCYRVCGLRGADAAGVSQSAPWDCRPIRVSLLCLVVRSLLLLMLAGVPHWKMAALLLCWDGQRAGGAQATMA